MKSTYEHENDKYGLNGTVRIDRNGIIIIVSLKKEKKNLPTYCKLY